MQLVILNLKSNTEMFEEKLNIKEIRKNKTRIIIFYHLSIRQQSKCYFRKKKKLYIKKICKNKTKIYILTTKALDSNQKVVFTNKIYRN